MPQLSDDMYCSQQIIVPPMFPFILRQYAKAAIRCQPTDLLRWSCAYFRCLALNVPPPIKPRLEYPLPRDYDGITPGWLKALLYQFANTAQVDFRTLWDHWIGACQNHTTLLKILCLGDFREPMDIPFLRFIALCVAFLCENLTQTMILVCEVLTEEPEGGSAMIPVETFVDIYQFLGGIDASKAQTLINRYFTDSLLNLVEKAPAEKEEEGEEPKLEIETSQDLGKEEAEEEKTEELAPDVILSCPDLLQDMDSSSTLSLGGGGEEIVSADLLAAAEEHEDEEEEMEAEDGEEAVDEEEQTQQLQKVASRDTEAGDEARIAIATTGSAGGGGGGMSRKSVAIARLAQEISTSVSTSRLERGGVDEETVVDVKTKDADVVATTPSATQEQEEQKQVKEQKQPQAEEADGVNDEEKVIALGLMGMENVKKQLQTIDLKESVAGRRVERGDTQGMISSGGVGGVVEESARGDARKAQKSDQPIYFGEKPPSGEEPSGAVQGVVSKVEAVAEKIKGAEAGGDIDDVGVAAAAEEQHEEEEEEVEQGGEQEEAVDYTLSLQMEEESEEQEFVDESKFAFEEMILEPIPGIGPIVPAELMRAVVEYMRKCGAEQQGMVMPRNIRHFSCPPLELFDD